MPLSKKHYDAIAAVIGEMVAAYPDAPLFSPERAARVAVEQTADLLAEYFAADSPRFDRGRFLRACGIEEQSA